MNITIAMEFMITHSWDQHDKKFSVSDLTEFRPKNPINSTNTIKRKKKIIFHCLFAFWKSNQINYKNKNSQSQEFIPAKQSSFKYY